MAEQKAADAEAQKEEALKRCKELEEQLAAEKKARERAESATDRIFKLQQQQLKLLINETERAAQAEAALLKHAARQAAASRPSS